MPDLAFDGRQLFLLYDHEVQALDAIGNVIDVYPAPAGMRLRAMDTIPGGSGDPAVLVVAAAPLDDVAASRLLVFHLG